MARTQMVPGDEGRAEAIAATSVLLEAAGHARNEETEAFFENQDARPASTKSGFDEPPA